MFLALNLWFGLLHAPGLLAAWWPSSMPSATNPAAFEAAMTSAVRAGRLLAWLIATGCVLIFAALVRLVVRDWRVAFLAALAFACSGGIAILSGLLCREPGARGAVMFFV